jgi:hypothetical protein
MFDIELVEPFSFIWKGKFYRVSHKGSDLLKGETYVET